VRLGLEVVWRVVDGHHERGNHGGGYLGVGYPVHLHAHSHSFVCNACDFHEQFVRLVAFVVLGVHPRAESTSAAFVVPPLGLFAVHEVRPHVAKSDFLSPLSGDLDLFFSSRLPALDSHEVTAGLRDCDFLE